MATREENLKKINEALENLSDEELDKIAGGEVQNFPTVWTKIDDEDTLAKPKTALGKPVNGLKP